MISKRDVSIGFIIGVITDLVMIAAILAIRQGDKTKFCPTCGKLYHPQQYYCDQDGDALKEKS